jgi:hypothetical protein
LEPLHGIFFRQSVGEAYDTGPLSSVGNIEARSAKHDVEVQTVNTDARIVFDTQVDVFLDAEAEVSGAREVVPPQLVFPDLLVMNERID